MPLPGWQRVSNSDPAAVMPLGTDSGGGSGTEHEIIMIAQFPRTTAGGAQSGEETNTLLAWVAGDGVGQVGGTENTAELWRVLPSTNVWERVLHINTAAGDPEANALRPGGGRDAIPDSCVLAAGAPARTSFTGNIADPVFIFTNNVDPVYVFPSGTGLHTFEDLTEDGDFEPFFAKSCEVFNNRVYFLNTSENGTRRRQRLRRTPPFTADPDNSQVGSGALDLKDFSGDGLRCERLGVVLVCYFEDGVAFIRSTGNYTAPDAVQTISTSRGLVSTHSVVNLGNDLHFGIFNDGWFELDPSGRFNEVGIGDIGGSRIGKWKQTFYNLLAKDPDKRGRLYCTYNPEADQVHISTPTDGTDENSVVWVYDRQSDRVWVDTYEALCFGLYNRQLTGATTYDSTTKTYTSIAPATYASLEAQFGVQAFSHGTSNGYIFQHDPDLINREKEAVTGSDAPAWSYKTHPMAGDSPRNLLVMDRFLLEHIGLDNTNRVTVIVAGDGGSGSEVTFGAITLGRLPLIHMDSTFIRHASRQLDVAWSGTGPIMVKSFEADVFDEQVELFS